MCLLATTTAVFSTDHSLSRLCLLISNLDMSKTLKKNSKGVTDHEAINDGVMCMADWL